MKIERTTNVAKFRMLSELKPGDVFWQEEFGPGTLYMVCRTNGHLKVGSYGERVFKNSGFVLAVRLGYEHGSPSTSDDDGAAAIGDFSKDRMVCVVDATLTVAER